jgi:hypothetical protein
MKTELEEVAEKYVNYKCGYYTTEQIQSMNDYIAGYKLAQERICDSEVIQIIRATKSDAEARRLIRKI